MIQKVNRRPYVHRDTEDVRVYNAYRRAAEQGRPATLTRAQWDDTVQHFAGKCAYCGGPYESLDHFIPVMYGGGTTKSNCIPCCNTCNRRKGSLPPALLTFVDPDHIDAITSYLVQFEEPDTLNARRKRGEGPRRQTVDNWRHYAALKQESDHLYHEIELFIDAHSGGSARRTPGLSLPEADQLKGMIVNHVQMEIELARYREQQAILIADEAWHRKQSV